MLNLIPVVGWFLSFFFSVCLAIPFFFLWNGLAPTYFYFVPEVYKHIPFWDCVWLAMLISILKAVLVPKFIATSSNSSK